MVDTKTTKCQCDCHKPAKIGWDHPMVTMANIVPQYLACTLLGIREDKFRQWCDSRQVQYRTIDGVAWMLCEELMTVIQTGKGTRKTEETREASDDATGFATGYLIAFEADWVHQYWPVVVSRRERDRICEKLQESGAETRYCAVEMTVPDVGDMFDFVRDQPSSEPILELTFNRS